MVKQASELLIIALEHVPTKHAQTIRMLEKTHASLQKSLKIEKAEERSLRHKYVNITFFKSNTSYHTSVGCESSRSFPERIPCIILVLNVGISPEEEPMLNTQLAEVILEQTNRISQDVRKNALQVYIKYEAYNDKKLN